MDMFERYPKTFGTFMGQFWDVHRAIWLGNAQKAVIEE
jgi:hypothetical protein